LERETRSARATLATSRELWESQRRRIECLAQGRTNPYAWFHSTLAKRRGPRQAALLNWQSARPFRFVRCALHGGLAGERRVRCRRRAVRSHPPNHRGPLRRPGSRRTKLLAPRSRLASSSRASCRTTSNRPAAAARDSAVAMAPSTPSSARRGLGGSSGEAGGSSAVAKTSGCLPPLWGAWVPVFSRRWATFGTDGGVVFESPWGRIS